MCPLRGTITNVTAEGGTEYIEKLSQRYIGRPYPWYGGRDQVWLVVTIAPKKLHSMGCRSVARLCPDFAGIRAIAEPRLIGSLLLSTGRA